MRSLPAWFLFIIYLSRLKAVVLLPSSHLFSLVECSLKQSQCESLQGNIQTLINFFVLCVGRGCVSSGAQLVFKIFVWGFRVFAHCVWLPVSVLVCVWDAAGSICPELILHDIPLGTRKFSNMEVWKPTPSPVLFQLLDKRQQISWLLRQAIPINACVAVEWEGRLVSASVQHKFRLEH